MTEHHYVRTADGRTERRSGPAIGVGLAEVLARGLPPVDIAFALLAAAAAAVGAASDAGDVHGDIGTRHVFIDETGAVAVEGFGVSRLVTAPGGPGPAADVYTLARTALVCLGSQLLVDTAAPDRGAHEAAVARALAALDLAPLADAERARVVSHLRQALAVDPNGRPEIGALATLFAAAASPGFAGWCAQAIDGGGPRRTRRPHRASAAPAAAPAPGGPPLVYAPVVGMLVGFVLLGGALFALFAVAYIAPWSGRPRVQPALPPPPPIAAGAEVILWISDDAVGTVSGCVPRLWFHGPAGVVLRPARVPATCTVNIGDQRASFDIEGAGSVGCSLDEGGTLICDKTRVP